MILSGIRTRRGEKSDCLRVWESLGNASMFHLEYIRRFPSRPESGCCCCCCWRLPGEGEDQTPGEREIHETSAHRAGFISRCLLWHVPGARFKTAALRSLSNSIVVSSRLLHRRPGPGNCFKSKERYDGSFTGRPYTSPTTEASVVTLHSELRRLKSSF